MNMKVRINTLPLLGVWDEVARLAVNEVSGGGCICILVNTVDEAQNLYSQLTSIAPENVELHLFHARFTMKNRQIIEKKCIDKFGKEGNRPRASILVATQVVEQSLDLDFDSMITAIAPIDLIFQRIGRVHRHQGRLRPKEFSEPKVTVLTPAGSIKHTPTAFVYKAWILKKTMETLSGVTHFCVPADIRPFIEKVYSAKPLYTDEDYTEWSELVFNTSYLHELAQNVIFPAPNPKRFFAAVNEGYFYEEGEGEQNVIQTRIGNDTLRIAIIPNELVEKAKNPNKLIVQEILSQVVSVPASKLKGRSTHPCYAPEVEGEGILRGILLLPSDNGTYAFKKGSKTLFLQNDEAYGLLIREE